MSMSDQRRDQMLDKIRHDIHDIDKQLTRIADALERAFPQRKMEMNEPEVYTDVVLCKTPSPSETRGRDRHPPIETVEKEWL